MIITLRVNGQQHTLDVEPRRLLVDALRDDLGLTGTTVGCGHGVCGSCTVLVDGVARRSCLSLAVQCQGREVSTVEGLADPDGALHPLQQAFTEHHALQCGFCTPGFLMLLAGALAEDPDLDADEERLTTVLSSNLCRCTGYVGIRAAAGTAAAVLRQGGTADQASRAPGRQPSVPVAAPVLVVTGVSGSGKSTVAALLAARLGWDLEEGDGLHPPANVAKMAAGHPLTDEDRGPWLDVVAGWISARTSTGRPGVITCSALRRRYRDVLRGDRVVFVQLRGGRARLAERLASRVGHFMPAALLGSQLEALEPLSDDEQGLVLDVDQDPGALVEAIITALALG